MAVLIREIVHVSAGLRRDGGGASHLGRLNGKALRRFAGGRGLRFLGLHLPASDGHPALDGYRTFGGSRARLAGGLVALQLRSRARLLFFDHPGPARVQSLLPRVLRAPYVVQLLGIEVWRPLSRSMRRALEGARRLISISRFTAARAGAQLSEDRQPLVVWPGIEPLAPAPPEVSPRLAGAGTGFVLVVGRMSADERYKGHEALLAALALLAKEESSARLVIVGDGSDRARLEERARELALAERVLFTGWVDDATLSALYVASACLALPSSGEGFGLVYLEAMAAGRPWIALDQGAPAEIAGAGEGGCLVSAGSPAPLAAAIRRLLADPALARRIGAAGRETWERAFTFAAYEKRLRPVLESAVGD